VNAPKLEVDEAALIDRLGELGMRPDELVPAGEGWWSRCYAFTDSAADERRVVRVGLRREYFEKDAIAAAWTRPDLPIPDVQAVERFGEHWLAVSTHAAGEPLEHLDAARFNLVMPQLARALAALRTIEPPGAGWGEFDLTGEGRYPSWRSYVAAAFGASFDPEFRQADWRVGLESSLATVVDASERRFADLELDEVPRRIVHADLLHGNVHVLDDKTTGPQITGVFDWGAGAYADPLLELACFEYWKPWHPGIDLAGLTEALDQPEPGNAGDRWTACLILIGVSHIAFTSSRPEVAEQARPIADRLVELIDL
jgi:aminoglycoside phosphotransferase (APT) family kinase protein